MRTAADADIIISLAQAYWERQPRLLKLHTRAPIMMPRYATISLRRLAYIFGLSTD
jgi:hypothetical protein